MDAVSRKSRNVCPTILTRLNLQSLLAEPSQATPLPSRESIGLCRWLMVQRVKHRNPESDFDRVRIPPIQSTTSFSVPSGGIPCCTSVLGAPQLPSRRDNERSQRGDTSAGQRPMIRLSLPRPERRPPQSPRRRPLRPSIHSPRPRLLGSTRTPRAVHQAPPQLAQRGTARTPGTPRPTSPPTTETVHGETPREHPGVR